MQTIDNKKLWNTTLSDIELLTSKANFSTWFTNTYIVKQDKGVVYIGVPNEFVKEWLYNKYHKVILKSLRGSAIYVRGIEYTIFKKEKKVVSFLKETKTPVLNKTNELPLNDLYINKENNLNPRYSFDSFIVGSFNELAHAASRAVIKRPGLIYNPLFIYGGTGYGKTHLIQSIGNHIKQANVDKKIFYVTSEKFSIDYVNSIQSNRVNSFKEKYRKYDVLIMDDIQFLSNKEKTQEELFHLFNTLYDNNKQIIFSSDKHPNYIPALEDRLKSRFGAGMIVDISQPDYESKLAILKSKLQLKNFNIPENIIDYLASSVCDSIRELEGVLNLVICQSQLKNRKISLIDVKSLVKEHTKTKKNISIPDIVKIIANFYNIEEEYIYQRTRRREVVRARQIAMYILRENFNISFPLIGQKIGGRDHTTVIHSCYRIKNDLKKNNTLEQEINQLLAMF